MSKIILASQSPYRKELLQRLGVPFETSPSEFDEDKLKKNITDPLKLTQELARAKAKVVQEKFPDAIIVGSDQVCHLKGEILGKSGSIDKSFQQLSKLSGKMHELITSYAILHNDKEVIKTNTTRLYMRNLTNVQVKKYLRKDNPIDCAGSYKLELNGISLFKKIETDDHTAIIGLPLIELANDLINFGICIPPEV